MKRLIWLALAVLLFLLAGKAGKDVITVTMNIGNEIVSYTFTVGQEVLVTLSSGGAVIATIVRRARRGNVEVETGKGKRFVVDKHAVKPKKDK